MHSLHHLEHRYQEENEIMQLVSLGDIQKIEKKLTNFTLNFPQQRTPNALRNGKNYMIILNTLLRKAAEHGGMHPLQLHEISSFYAKKIELLTSETAIPFLAQDMIRKYTLLVKEYSLNDYSLLVRKSIAHINHDLTQDLSLQAQADLFSVTPSYLSHLFKKETGMTLSNYVNQQRINHAKYLLTTTDLQIQQIAHDCGFIDICYFSKIFKKYTGVPPSEYRK